MDRRLMVGTAFGALAASPVFASAQETTTDVDDRFSALEARIAELEARVEALEAAGEPSATEDESVGSDAAAGDSATVSGSGTSVSEVFLLSAGRYRVNAEVSAAQSFTGFILWVHGPNGVEENLFNELWEGAGVHVASTIFDAREDGEYFLAAENVDGDWTVAFEPF